MPGTPDFGFGIMALPVACTRVASSGERPHQVSAPPGVSPGPKGGRDLELPRSKSTRLAKAGVGGCNESLLLSQEIVGEGCGRWIYIFSFLHRRVGVRCVGAWIFVGNGCGAGLGDRRLNFCRD